MLLTTLITAAALFTAQPAPQPFSGQAASATLTQPQESRLNLDGRNWACDASGQCLGRGGGTTQPLMRECRRFVARFGAVSAYARQDVALTEAELAQCNTADSARVRRATGA